MEKNKKFNITGYLNYLFDEYDKVTLTKESPPFKKIKKFFHDNPWADSTIYYQNLEDLSLKYNPDLPEYNLSVYNPVDNQLVYKDKNLVAHELFHIASNAERKENSGGLLKEFGLNKAIDEGVTEYFATLIEPSHTSCYPIETFVAESIAYTYGISIYKDYFKSDPNSFINRFSNPKQMSDLFKKMDIFQELYINFLKNKKNDKLLLKKIELLEKEILKDITTIVYNNEKNKNNNIDTLKETIKSFLEKRGIIHGFTVEFDAYKYVTNVIDGLSYNSKKK